MSGLTLRNVSRGNLRRIPGEERMESRYNPFSTIETKRVLAQLEAEATLDPDALDARRSALLAEARFPRTAGTFLMILGGIVALMLLSGVVQPWIAGMTTGRLHGAAAAGWAGTGPSGAFAPGRAVPGLSLLLLGWWARRRGVRSIEAVEAGFAEFRSAAGRRRPAPLTPLWKGMAGHSRETRAGGTGQMSGSAHSKGGRA